MNNVGNLSTLMNEANASYHAAALAKKYNLPREMQKAGNKSLDYSFRTYESNAANKMMTDDTVRLLGKYKNKYINKEIWKLIQISINSIITFRNIPYPWI